MTHFDETNRSTVPTASEDQFRELQRVAARIRLRAVRMIEPYGHGYLGQALSSAEITATLFCSRRAVDVSPETCDRFVLSPGHYVIAVYGALVETGRLSAEALATYGADGSSLEAIGTERTPGVDATCGSLGQSLSVAIGIALAGRLHGQQYRTYAFLSDGELEEGQVWEAALFAAHQRLNSLTVILDCNNSQVDGAVDWVTTLEPIEEKWRAFGWSVFSVNGHDLAQLQQAFESARAETSRPSIIVARTSIIHGISFLNDQRDGHFIKLTLDEAALAAQELESIAHA